jgi:hypothetical protein
MRKPETKSGLLGEAVHLRKNARYAKNFRVMREKKERRCQR